MNSEGKYLEESLCQDIQYMEDMEKRDCPSPKVAGWTRKSLPRCTPKAAELRPLSSSAASGTKSKKPPPSLRAWEGAPEEIPSASIQADTEKINTILKYFQQLATVGVPTFISISQKIPSERAGCTPPLCG